MKKEKGFLGYHFNKILLRKFILGINVILVGVKSKS